MSESNEVRGEMPVSRNWIATSLMLVAALGAFYALVTSIGTAAASGPDTQQVEWWRVLGFLFFTGLFILLAVWPQRYPGLWELVILDKAILTLVELTLIRNNAANAVLTAEADGILTVILVAAYLINKGYRSWLR